MIQFDVTTGGTLPLRRLYAPIHDELQQAVRLFDEELVSGLPFINGLCETVRSYRGKMLRPALLLLSGRATGAMAPAHELLAAVVELVHMATLVHDDVLDEADERRRQPTVGAMSGNVAAVLLGDYLISHAFHLCSALESSHASRRIGATTNAVCEGELLQNQCARQVDLSESAYLDIVRRKTGELTAVACELGAHFAGADEDVVDALRSFGLSAGVAFQIVDDVLDVTGDRSQVGKTLDRDLTLGKPTLPTIHCLANANRQTADALTEALLGAVPCPRARFHGWLAQTGSIAYAISAATRHTSEAVARLAPLPPSDAKDSLVAMAEFIVRRYV